MLVYYREIALNALRVLAHPSLETLELLVNDLLVPYQNMQT